MAGIGFEIRKILKKNTLLSVFEAYSYAGLIGSGPWLLSISRINAYWHFKFRCSAAKSTDHSVFNS